MAGKTTDGRGSIPGSPSPSIFHTLYIAWANKVEGEPGNEAKGYLLELSNGYNIMWTSVKDIYGQINIRGGRASNSRRC